MVGAALGKEGFELLPDGLDEVRWECGHGACSFRLGSLENSPHDGASVPALHHDALPIDGSSKSDSANFALVPECELRLTRFLRTSSCGPRRCGWRLPKGATPSDARGFGRSGR